MFSDTQPNFTAGDIFLSSIYIMMILFGCWFIKLKNPHLPYYRFFLPALFVKFIGTILFCCVYIYHYKGGDAIAYFRSSHVLGDLLFKEPATLVKILFTGDVSFTDLTKFDSHKGTLLYTDDKYSFFFVRLITPLNILSFGNFLTCSILLAAVAFTGSWKLYTVFCNEFPHLTKPLAMAIFFFPSVLFWGSGLLKDTVTISAVGWFIYALYTILNTKRAVYGFVCLLISALILLFIKPYILYGLIGAGAIWITAYYLKKIPLTIERYFYAPVIVALFVFISAFLVYGLAKEQGRFSVDKAQRVVATKQANTRAASSFYTPAIGNSIASVTKWIFVNINVTLFRPYYWEAKNFMMKCASLENLFLMGFLIWLLIKFRIVFLFKHIFSSPLLIFSFFFVIILSLIVGFSTDNFGTLDRFRVPVLPFYLVLCFILRSYVPLRKFNSSS